MKLMHWALVGLLASPMAAQAFETRLNGFLSVAAGATLQEGDTFIIDPVTYQAYDSEISIRPETMVAIQSYSQVNDRLSATAQMVGFAGEVDEDNLKNFTMRFEWAYVNYELLEGLELKLGRMRTPFYAYSDSLDLGYSYVWVRPPGDVYNVFLTNLQGGKLDYSFLVGDWFSSASFFYGETVGIDPETNSIGQLDSLAGVVLEVENGAFSFRGMHAYDDAIKVTRPGAYDFQKDCGSAAASGDTTCNGLTTVFDGIPGVDPVTAPAVSDLEFELPTTFSSLSAIYDDGRFLLNAEYTLSRFTNDINNNEYAWYATGGIRIGDFTPHLTYSTFKQSDNGETLALVPSYSVAPNPIAIKDYPQDVETWTAGIRWDFDIAASMKLEYSLRTDNTETPPEWETYMNTLPEDQRRSWSPFGDAQVISVAVDVVF